MAYAWCLFCINSHVCFASFMIEVYPLSNEPTLRMCVLSLVHNTINWCSSPERTEQNLGLQTVDSVPWVHGICPWGTVQDKCRLSETKHICSKNNLLHICTHNCFTSWYDLVIVSVNDTLPSIKIRITPRRNVHSSRYAGGVSNRQTINHMWRTFLGANMLWTPCQAENRFLNIAITPPYTLLIIYHVAVKTAKFNMIIIYVTRWAKIWHILHFKNEIGLDIVLVTIDRASVQTSKWSAAQFPRYSHKRLLIMKNYISSKCNVFTLLR